MVYGLWQSASGLQAQDYRQTVLSNNLANSETPGFKADRVSFVERLNAARARGSSPASVPSLAAMTGGLFEAPLYTDFSQGPLTASDNRLDLAIQGDGFFKVQTKEGVRVTRDGRMLMNKDGTLVHAASGGTMLDVNGRSISVDPNLVEKIKIDGSGIVKQGDGSVGQLAIVDFSDRQRLEKTGKNLFDSGSARPIAARGEVRQNFIEQSGAEPISMLVDLMSASRAYQLNATMISLQDESLGRVVNQLGRIS